MPQSLYEVRDRVGRFVTRHLGEVRLTEESTMIFSRGSAEITLAVGPLERGYSVVEISSTTNLDVPRSESLFEFVALGAGAHLPFASTRLEPGKSGFSVLVYHRLLGEYLDLDELAWAIESVAEQADRIDDLIAERFGGRHPQDPSDE